MNWYSVIASGIIGGIAGLISSIIAKKLLKPEKPNREKTVKIISVITFILIMAIGNNLISPHVELYNNKKIIEKDLNNIKDMPLFSYVKKHDPQKYELVLNDFAKIMQDNKTSSNDQMLLIFHNYGTRLGAYYFQKASNEIMIKYMESTIKFFKDLNNENPEFLCQMLFPAQFGTFQLDKISNLKSQAELFSLLEEVIKSGVKNENADNNNAGQILFNSYRENFIKNNPEKGELLNRLNQITSSNEKKQLALAVIAIYEGVLKLPPKESISIIRFLFAGA